MEVTNMYQNKLLFGAAYYDEYMPYDRIDEDMRLMKDAGMNVIRIAESTWSTWEPRDGVFDFTHLHRMLKASESHGIQVIVGTPTYAIPSWLAKKHPDILSVTKNGQELYGHRQLTDITNKNYRFHAECLIRRLMDEVKDYPHVIGFQLDNETRAAGAASKNTQKLFIKKLREKYPDIQEFNREFGLDYWSNRVDDWGDFPDIRGTINGSLSAAYKEFLRDCITDFLHWQEQILREYMRDDQFITHNFDFSWTGYSFGIQPEVNQYDCATFMDVAGCDIYHLSQDDLDGKTISFGGSVGRSLKKDNYLVLETQSQGNVEWLPYEGQLRLQAYSHLASGANGIMYWNWHSIHNSFESYWKGILSHDLTPGETYYELADWRKEVAHIEKELINLKKDNSIAILVDNRSLTGLDEFPIGEDADYNHILRWMYDACYDMNLECDLVSANDSFDGYPVLMVPALYSATEETIQKLRNYAAQGGNLILGFKSCFSDENLKIYHDSQPHGLTDVIGASYERFTVPKGVKVHIAGCRSAYNVQSWMELVQPKEAKIWATYIHPYWGENAAVTHHKYGEGSATYIGCYIESSGLKEIIKNVCAIARVRISPYRFPVIRKSGVNETGHRINYIFNYSGETQVFTYDGNTGTDLLNGRDVIKNSDCVLRPWDLMIVKETN
jgi:beta-galactosidase